MAKDDEIFQDRRKYLRIKKHFILSFYDKKDPTVKHEVSQLKNISLGGSCFITIRPYESSTKLVLELKTPYLAGTIHLEGTVLESLEKVPDLLYETRLVFDALSPQAEFVLNKIVNYFQEGSKKDHE